MRKILIFLVLTLISLPSFADKKDRSKMMEDILKFKIDYLAQEMSLSEKTKADFAPLYKEYDTELRNTGTEMFRFERELKKKTDPTEADYKKLAELQKESREKYDAVQKKFEPKFEEILSAKQIYQMHKAEEKFLEKMKEMRKKHGSPNHKGGSGPRDNKKKSTPSPQASNI